MQLHDLLHGCDAGVAVQITAGRGEAVVGQHAAEQPEIRVHIPVAHAGDVYRVGAASGGGLDELLHRLGHGVKASSARTFMFMTAALQLVSRGRP